MSELGQKDIKLKVPAELWKQMVKYYKKEYKGVIPKFYSFELFTKHRLYGAYVQLERLKSLKVKSTRCLDAGCGIGTFAALANLSGFNYYAYDIDKEAITIAKKLFEVNNISTNKLGTAPSFTNTPFDLITSFEVVEHLNNMQTYFDKLLQVLSPNGNIFVETPNYIIPFEPHYYALIPPFGLRSWKWFCCRLKGATNKNYFNGINFVNKYSLEAVFKKNGLKIKNIGDREWIEQIINPPDPIKEPFIINFKNTGDREWIEQIINPPDPIRSEHFFRISKLVRDFKLLPLVRFFARVGFYTPLVYLGNLKKE